MGILGRSTLSVIVPNYNHGEFLEAALLSVLEQERPPDQVIVIDDCSTDDSVVIVERLTGMFSQLCLVRHERNLGVHAAMRRGIEESTGSHLMFLAADDYLLPGFFEGAMALLERYPQAGVCCGLLQEIDMATGEMLPPPTPQWRNFGPRYLGPDEVGAAVEQGLAIGGNFAIVKKDSLLAAGGFDPELRGFTDWFTLMVIALREGVCLLPQPVAVARRMATSYFSTESFGSRMRMLAAIVDRLEAPEYQDVVSSFRRGAFENYHWAFFFMVARHPGHWRWLSLPYLRLRVRHVRDVPGRLLQLIGDWWRSRGREG